MRPRSGRRSSAFSWSVKFSRFRGGQQPKLRERDVPGLGGWVAGGSCAGGRRAELRKNTQMERARLRQAGSPFMRRAAGASRRLMPNSTSAVSGMAECGDPALHRVGGHGAVTRRRRKRRGAPEDREMVSETEMGLVGPTVPGLVAMIDQESGARVELASTV